MPTRPTSSQAIAARVVLQVVFRRRQLNRTLARALGGPDQNNRALITEMVNGVLRWFWLLEHHLNDCLERPMRRKDYDIQCLLYVGLYQLEFMRTPPHASVHETVSATAALGKPWARNLVNAILRNYLRAAPQRGDSQLNDQARYSHPQWLIDALRKEWPNEWPSLLNANNRKPTMTLRVNVQRTSPAQNLERLATIGIAARHDRISPVALQVDERINVRKLPGCDQGDVSVQSAASQMVALSMDLAPGQRVLDDCSAPGGKLLHMLEIEPQLAKVVAIEIDPARATEIVDNLQRARIDAELLIADAASPRDWWDGEPFDRILVDAPCSALGVISKHPDIKHHRKPEDVGRVSDQQARLLEALLPLLSRGGKLLYATCTILAQENDSQIEDVLRKQPGFRCEPLSPELGKATRFGRQRLQDDSGRDGFYCARLVRQ